MRRAILPFLLLPLLSAIVAAQPLGTYPPRFALGVEAGPLFSWYTDLPMMAPSWHGVERADATGFGFLGGLSGTWWMRETSGIRGSLRYERQHPTVTVTRTIPAQVDLDPTDSITPPVAPTPMLIESSGDFDVINLSAAYIQRIAGYDPLHLSVLIGPTISFVTVSRRTESVELASSVEGRLYNPQGMVVNDGRKLILFDGDPNNRSHSRFSILGGLQLESRLSRKLSLVSSAEFDFPLAGVADGRIEGRVYSLLLRGGVVWYMD
jgi:hypothetical protein